MRNVVIAVYDVQVGAYMRPMFVPSEGAGIRAFSDEVNRKDSEMNKHPQDYRLDRLGEWNEIDGGFVVDANEPRQLVTAVSVLVRE